MTSPSVLWLERGTSVPGRTSQVLAVCLAIAWAFLIVARAWQPLSPSRFECRSDPWDFLSIGETLEPSSLAFLVEAHCENAKYRPDGWIELRYRGARVDVELQRVDIAGVPFFRVASIGGVAAP
jgi:hypothetical protein